MDVVELRPRLWRWALPHPDWEPDDAEDGEGRVHRIEDRVAYTDEDAHSALERALDA